MDRQPGGCRRLRLQLDYNHTVQYCHAMMVVIIITCFDPYDEPDSRPCAPHALHLNNFVAPL